MTAEIALKLGQAAGLLFTRGDHRHRVIIGKDTRLSGYMLEPALTAGFIGAGMDVILAGPLPTPAIAMLTRSLRADLGVVISASHNPYEDNGIKLFGPDGSKLSDEIEAEIEALMASDFPAASPRRRRWAAPRAWRMPPDAISSPRNPASSGACGSTAAHRPRLRPWRRLQGRPGRLMGARRHGHSARRRARRLQHQQGCGSTAPEHLCAAVLEHGADIGIALDGDADRVSSPMSAARSSTATRFWP